MPGAGPEERNILAADNENEALSFFEKMCKWKKVTTNFDIQQTERRSKRGLDLVLGCFDPFMNKQQNLVVECKYRHDQTNVNTKTLAKMIYDLKEKIELAPLSISWSGTSFESEIHSGHFGNGVLFLKMREYADSKYQEALSKVLVEYAPRAKRPPVIGVLSNKRLSKLVEFISGKKGLRFYYPVYGSNSDKRWEDYLSFSYLFSDIIAGSFKRTDDGEEKEHVFILSFERPSKDSVQYISNLIKNWYLRKRITDVYFTEGNNSDIPTYENYRKPDDRFKIKIIGGDKTCDFRMEEKVND